MPFRVVLDACVLAPHLLCDVLLHLAEDDEYVPLWSGDILDEVDRRLTTKHGGNLTAPASESTRRDERSRMPMSRTIAR